MEERNEIRPLNHDIQMFKIGLSVTPIETQRYCFNVKAKRELPAAVAMYCLPLTE
jgi:hypothetical protein